MVVRRICDVQTACALAMSCALHLRLSHHYFHYNYPTHPYFYFKYSRQVIQTKTQSKSHCLSVLMGLLASLSPIPAAPPHQTSSSLLLKCATYFCGGLKENVPHKLMYLHSVSSGWHCLERLRRCGFI